MSASTRGRATDEDRRRGAAIRAARHAKGLSAPKLAHATGINVSYIYELELGRRPVPLKMCRRIAAFFEIPVDAISSPQHASAKAGTGGAG